MTLKKLPNSVGAVVGPAVYEVLDGWDVKDSVCGRCFDTTSSNTSQNIGAVIYLQDLLGIPILWLVCRHHVGEVILTHVLMIFKQLSDCDQEMPDSQLDN